MITSHYSRLVALLTVVFGMLVFSLGTQLLGELVGVWATSRPAMSIYLGIIVVVARLQMNLKTRSSHNVLHPMLVATFCSSIWIFVSKFHPTNLITFLGYGYDNYGWLMQGRIILENGGSVLISGGSGLGPTFMQDSSQVPGSLIASMASLMGVAEGDVRGLMTILTVISLAIPTICVTAIVFGFTTHLHRRSEFVLVTVASIVFFFTGYLSRIWFSGYLGSNLGTMCAVLVVVYIATSTSKNFAGISLLVVIMTHTYPLFSIIGAAILLVPIFWAAIPIGQLRNRAKEVFPIRTTIFLGIFGLLLFLPYHATKRSYGASQFLTDGGIESFPISYFVLVLFLFLLPLTLNAFIFGQQKYLFASCIVYGVFGFGAAVYSFRHVDKLAYYPTKILIAFSFMMFGTVFASWSRVETRWLRHGFYALALCLISAYVLFQPKSEVFIGAFMGEAPTVLDSARKAKLEVVDGKMVSELSDVSRAKAMPILFLSNTRESELNTRWINTLSLQWNDKSWGYWTKLRSLIGEKKFGELTSQIDNNVTIIVTDDVNLYEQIKPSYLGMVCLRELILICNKS